MKYNRSFYFGVLILLFFLGVAIAAPIIPPL